jgi:hypothetical protein
MLVLVTVKAKYKLPIPPPPRVVTKPLAIMHKVATIKLPKQNKVSQVSVAFQRIIAIHPRKEMRLGATYPYLFHMEGATCVTSNFKKKITMCNTC